MIRPPDSLALRLLAGAGAWCLAVLVAAGLMLSALFKESAERGFDARLRVLLEALVAATQVEGDGLEMADRALGEPRFDVPYSGWYWQVQGPAGTLTRSRSLWDQELAPAAAGGEGAVVLSGPEGQVLRGISRAIRLPGEPRPFRFTVAGDVAEMAAELRDFRQTLIWILGLLGGGLLAGVLLQMRFGLAPLSRLRADLAAIRDGRASRVSGRFPRELAPLAAEINGLLQHNAAVMQRARTHVGNLAHSMKTPLAVLRNEAGAENTPLADSLRRQLAAMQRLVDHHLSRARALGNADVLGARTPVAEAAEGLARTIQRIYRERPLQLDLQIEERLWFRGDRNDLEEMLGNLLDNAGKWAAGRILVRGRRQGETLQLAVEDDGPGLDPAARTPVLERGTRLDESVPGSGLGLAIVADIAALYGGRLRLERSALGGVRAALDLPAAPPGRAAAAAAD